MDELFEELAGVDSNRTFNFFLSSLRDIKRAEHFCEDDLLYVASVLAHYSQTSRYDATHVPVMSELTEVFDNFIFQTATANDLEILEFGGSQVLLFTGFFRDQMRRRHNVHWYDQVGQALYGRASQYANNGKKRKLFDRMAGNFPVWTLACRDLSQMLRENRFLLKLD